MDAMAFKTIICVVVFGCALVHVAIGISEEIELERGRPIPRIGLGKCMAGSGSPRFLVHEGEGLDITCIVCMFYVCPIFI
jgi:hypothetical protein